jgi:hypothetical protein
MEGACPEGKMQTGSCHCDFLITLLEKNGVCLACHYLVCVAAQ